MSRLQNHGRTRRTIDQPMPLSPSFGRLSDGTSPVAPCTRFMGAQPNQHCVLCTEYCVLFPFHCFPHTRQHAVGIRDRQCIEQLQHPRDNPRRRCDRTRRAIRFNRLLCIFTRVFADSESSESEGFGTNGIVYLWASRQYFITVCNRVLERSVGVLNVTVPDCDNLCYRKNVMIVFL